MLHLYRTWNIQTRLTILGLLLLIGGAVAFAYHHNVLLVLGAIAAIGVAVDIVAHRPRLILAALIVLSQLALLTYLAFDESVLLASAKASSAEFVLDLLIAVYGLIALIILQIFGTVYFLKGRIWLNLLMLYGLTDIGFLYFAGLTQNVIFGLLIALGITLAYAAIRFPYRQLRFDDRLELRLNKRTERRIQDIFQHKGFQIKQTEDYNLLRYVALPEHTSLLYALCIVDEHMRFELKKNRVLINEADFTPGVEIFLNEVKRFAHAYKVPKADIVPVLLLANHQDLYAKQLAVFNRIKPDLKIGDVYIVNTAGLTRLMKITNRLKEISSKRVTARFGQLFSIAN